MSEITLFTGLVLYMEEFNRQGKATEIKPVTVTAIGRKYFYIDGNQLRKFDIKTLKYTNKEYSQFNVQLYFTREEIEQRQEREQLISAFKSHFATWNTWGHTVVNTLDELREAAKILGINLSADKQ